MVNITHKSNTLRKAIAQAIVKVSNESTIQTVLEKKVPKGDVFEMAKTAGLFAAKRTSDMIPDCHPLPIEFTEIRYHTSGLEIQIEAEIHTIYKTGVEVEAMHAASIVALTIYDMLKPIDKGISIEKIKLLDKKGGKSELKEIKVNALQAAVVVCSDSLSKGIGEDKSGIYIADKLRSYQINVAEYLILPDDKDTIRKTVNKLSEQNINLIICTGGTGLSARDVTPEALESLLDKKIPGVEETIRAYGQQRNPYAMLSRSMAGLIKDTLVLAFPGSFNGVKESMDALFPHILHLFEVQQGTRHEA